MPNNRVRATGEALPGARLSELIRDPFVRAAFERAEREGGCLVEPTPRLPVLVGGEARKLEDA